MKNSPGPRGREARHRRPVVRFKGKLLKLVVEKRRLPNGHVARVEIIHHPGAVLIVPFKSTDKVIFLRQYRPSIRRYLYELPAGTRKSKESVLLCAQRELTEETGHKAANMKYLGKIVPVPGYSTEIIHIFKATRLRPEAGVKDFDEILEPLTLSRSQVRSLFRQKKIIDAKTICGLVYCGWL